MFSTHSLRDRVRTWVSTLSKKLTRRSYFELTQKQDQDLVFRVIGDTKIPSFTQLKYVSRFFSDIERLLAKAALFLILIGVLVLGVDVYINRIVEQPATGGEYVEAVIGAPTYINPVFAQTNAIDQDITQLVFSGLMKLNAVGQLTGDLAESYTINEEQTTYTFILRNDVRWHDGVQLTAEDVVFTVQSIQDQNFKSPLYVTFRNVQVRALDDRTVTFTLSEPFAPFLSVMTFGILPAHLWQSIDPSHAILAELNLKPIGSGPYIFDALVKDRRGNIKEYRLKRNKDYYQEGPFVDNIHFKFFGSFEEASNALLTGNVDGFGFLPQRQGQALNEEDALNGFEQFNLALPQYTALFFNQKSNPALEDRSVRQALALATSRHQIISDAFGNHAQPVFAPILPGMVGYDETLQHVLFDPAQAEKLLDDAGWTRVPVATEEDSQEETTASSDTTLGLEPAETPQYTRVKTIGGEETPLTITLTTLQREENIAVAETIRSLWQRVGITVNVHIVELARMQKDVVKPRAYEVLLFGQILGRDPDPYPFWHSSQANDPGLNLALYQNKEIDKILEEARQTTDRDARQEKYVAFQEQIIQDVPALFLYSLQYTYLLPTNLKGFETLRINQPADRFSSVAHWFSKTKKRITF